MADWIRTFIAIDVPAKPFGEVIAALRQMGRPVRALGDPLHLTLKFLGETPPEAIPQISRELDLVAHQQTAFELELCGLGAFPRIDRPAIVWAGVRPVEPVTTIAEDLALRLEPVGFPIETRPFHPHVTLARVKARPPEELSILIDDCADRVFGHVTVSELILYESRLKPSGPEYSVLNTTILR